MSGVFRINGYNSVRRINTKKPASGAATGWWLSGGIPAANCIAAYQPKGAASYAASKVNLANPGTLDAQDGGNAPTWNSNIGWQFTKANQQWIETGYVIPVDQSHTLAFRLAGNNTAQSPTLVGTGVDNSANFGLYMGGWINYYYLHAGGAYIRKTAYANYDPVVIISGSKGYIDYSYQQFYLPAGSGTNVHAQTIGAQRINSGMVNYSTVQFVCYAVYDTVLTDAQALALTTAMNAL